MREKQDIIKLTVMGNPLAKKRPRFSTKGGKVRAYNVQKGDEQDFAWVAKQAGCKIMDGPLWMDVRFYMKRPKSHYRTGKFSDKLKKDAPYWCDKKPDLDNLVKFVKDSLNGIAWNDDSQVVYTVCCKGYSEQPKTEISIGIKND